MASDHVNRTNRPNACCTDQPANVKKSLANSEPSTHGTRPELGLANAAAQTRIAVRAGIICDDVSGFESHMPSQADGSLRPRPRTTA
jgi:hypothetical protein